MRKQCGCKRATGTKAPLLPVAAQSVHCSVSFMHDQFANGLRFRIPNALDDVMKPPLLPRWAYRFWAAGSRRALCGGRAEWKTAPQRPRSLDQVHLERNAGLDRGGRCLLTLARARQAYAERNLRSLLFEVAG